MTPGPRPRGWADTLALRLFLLTWVSLVVSHAAAYLVVHSLALSPPPPRPGHMDPPGRPPLPTFPSLPPTPGLDPPPSPDAPPGAAPAPAGLPLGVLLLDYGVRLLVIAVAAWWGSRWLARPVTRLVAAAEALGPALAAGQHPQPLDEHLGTREVQATATVFNRMAQQIQELFRGRGLMIAAISHDLRTPLTRMRLRVETAAIDDGLRQRCVRDLKEMNALIDTVLEVFRGSDGPPPPLQRTDIAALVQALVDDRAELGADIHMSGQAPPVPADPAGLRRVLGNLLDNAQRYAGAASVTVRQEDGAVWVAVEDRGPGIPDEQLEQVLQPFVRVEGSRNAAGGGTGLGLFIARQLVQRMGGELRLRNRTGGGLSACVRLPAAAGDPAR